MNHHAQKCMDRLFVLRHATNWQTTIIFVFFFFLLLAAFFFREREERKKPLLPLLIKAASMLEHRFIRCNQFFLSFLFLGGDDS
jgi:hypothetical protein